MRILSWNIQQGGVARAGRIVDSIVKSDSDVVILSEYRRASVASVGRILESRGYFCKAETELEAASNGIAVFTRGLEVINTFRHIPMGSRWLSFETIDPSLTIAALHIPNHPASTAPGVPLKADTWAAVLRFARAHLDVPTVIIGDFNTGQHELDEDKKTFHCEKEFVALSNAGFIDAWRDRNGATAREASWLSAAGGKFRIDHAFVSLPLRNAINECGYSHEERLERISDHSMLLLDLSV